MRASLRLVAVLALAGALAGAEKAGARPANDAVTEEGAVIALKDLGELDGIPKPVLATIERKGKGGRVVAIERRRHDDRPYYNVQLAAGEHEWQLKVADDGAVMTDAAADNAIDTLPAPVKRSLLAAAGDDDVVSIDKRQQDGKRVFEAKLRGSHGTRKIRFDADGRQVDGDDAKK